MALRAVRALCSHPHAAPAIMSSSEDAAAPGGSDQAEEGGSCEQGAGVGGGGVALGWLRRSLEEEDRGVVRVEALRTLSEVGVFSLLNYPRV